jgi:hypothetical protein
MEAALAYRGDLRTHGLIGEATAGVWLPPRVHASAWAYGRLATPRPDELNRGCISD